MSCGLHLWLGIATKGIAMNQPDMAQLMRQAQEMQAQLERAQQEILASTVEGQAGNGLVKVKMSGGGEVLDISIDPKIVDPDDVETLQDLVLSAVNQASRSVADLSERKLGPISGFGGQSLGSL